MSIESPKPMQRESVNPLEFKKNQDASETKLLEKEATEADYRNVLKEQLDIIYTKPMESLRALNDERLEAMRTKEDDVVYLKTRNESLEGKKHPETDVPYERKVIVTKDGKKFEGVFPVFPSIFTVHLPENLYEDTDKKQFDECNRQLKKAVEDDPELAKKFTPEQLEQIMNGETPDGYTWHHNEETGKMELVDSEIHAKTAHTGGRVIWGGGQENR